MGLREEQSRRDRRGGLLAFGMAGAGAALLLIVGLASPEEEPRACELAVRSPTRPVASDLQIRIDRHAPPERAAPAAGDESGPQVDGPLRPPADVEVVLPPPFSAIEGEPERTGPELPSGEPWPVASPGSEAPSREARMERGVAPGRAATLTVRVLAAENGEPLCDAVVTLTPAEGDPRERAGDNRGEAVFGAWRGGSALLRAHAPGRAPRLRRLTALGGDRLLTLRLRRGPVLIGRVLEAGSGRPTALAVVDVYRARTLEDTLELPQDPAPLHSAAAGPEGYFRIDGLPRDERVVLVARAPGRARQARVVNVGVTLDPDVVDPFEMVPGRRLVGTVRLPDGRPARGATVFVVDSEETGIDDAVRRRSSQFSPTHWREYLALGHIRESGDPDLRVLRRVTGPDGRFETTGIPTDRTFHVIATARGLSASAMLRDALRAGSDHDADRQLVLRMRRPLEVNLTDSRGGAVTGARIRGEWKARPLQFRETRPGRYRTEDGGDAPVALVIQAPGAPRVYFGVAGEGGGVGTVDIRLPPLGDIRVQVEDAEWEPVCGALVTFRGTTRLTDSAGRCSMPAYLGSGGPVVAHAVDHAPDAGTGRAGATDPVGLQIVPVGSVRVRLEPPPGVPEPAWYRVVVLAEGGGSVLRMVESANWGNGSAEIDGVPTNVGRVRVDAYAEGCVRAMGDSLEVAQGRICDAGTLHLQPALQLAGTVEVLPGGALPPDALIVLRSSPARGGAPIRSFLPDHRGRFAAEVHKAGRVVASPTASGFVGDPAGATVEWDETASVSVRLIAENVLYGAVRDLQGHGLGGAAVQILDDAGRLVDQVQSRADGRFWITVRNGSYVVVAKYGSESSVSKGAAMREGRCATCPIDLLIVDR